MRTVRSTPPPVTFLRSCDDEIPLIAVNFDSNPCNLKINIPLHAFETLGIPLGDCVAVDPLSHDMMRKHLSPDLPFETEIGPARRSSMED